MKSQFENRKILIMGLGLNPRGSGVSAAKFFALQGARVTVTDLKTKRELAPSLKLLKGLPIRYVLGKHNESDFKNADLVIKNPGVRRDSPYIQIARQSGAVIESDVSIFWKLCPAPIIGVTGTRGKSTTSALIGEMLKERNPPPSPFVKGGRKGDLKREREGVFVGGNIQMSPLNFLNQVKKDSLVVLELSSWMLEDLTPTFSPPVSRSEIGGVRGGPRIAVLTNLMPDHLNTYKNFRDYIKAKALIFKNQTKNDFAVLNYDDLNVRKVAKKIKAKKIWFSKKHPTLKKIIPLEKIALLGEHNISNILAAVAVAKIEGVSNKGIASVLKTFKGLPNRLEFVREFQGIKFYNDTTSTMPEATIAALRALAQISNSVPSGHLPQGDKFQIPNIILIAGGSDKKLDYKNLAKEIKKYCKAAVLFEGIASEKILKQLLITNYSPFGRSLSLREIFTTAGRQFPIVKDVGNMRDAVKNAVKLAKGGDIVLLSPAAASFGLFQNEFDRGERFVNEVRKLK